MPVTQAKAAAAVVHTVAENYGVADTPVQMMALGLIILAAHLGGKLCSRLRLSEVTGQLVGGALVGPYALHLVGLLPGVRGGAYDDALHAFHFFVFVFLGIVAFGIGEELHINRIRKVGRSALMICLIQAFTTWTFISSAFYIVPRLLFPDINITAMDALLTGSIGISTAPSGTVVPMNQTLIDTRLRPTHGRSWALE